jgi:hypothetical protein
VPLTAGQLNRATLARQLLLDRAQVSVVDAVRQVVAVQAQDPPSVHLALWNRVADLDPAEVHAAFAEHAVVKATLMRITLHAVDAADYPAFQHAMVSSLRASRLADPRFTETGLTASDADAVLPDVLDFTSEPRTNAEVEAWLEARFGRPLPRAWWALRTFAPVVHAPTGPPWSHGPRPSYLTARTAPSTGDPAPSVQHVVRRYLEGFGPATPQDIGQFSILRMPVVRAALDALRGSVERLEGPDGAELFDVIGRPRPDDSTPAPPRLLGMWDSVLLAYADRGRIVPSEYRTTIFRRNGDVLPTLLVDGYVAGVWRPVDGGIEASAFRDLPARTWKGLAAEAKALEGFLDGRDRNLYRRQANWWASLPDAEVRLLPG